MNKYIYIFILLMISGAFHWANGQDGKLFQEKKEVATTNNPDGSDTTRVTNIIVEHADNARFVNTDEGLIKYLNGEVRLIQDSTFMYCDTAVLIGNQLMAFGNVIIVQNDTINVFADSLNYNGDNRIAKLYYNVILSSNTQELFTEFLIYDLNTKVGSYTEGALLKNENSEIKSRVGKYYVNEKQVRFFDRVTIENEKFMLWTDSLLYDSGADIAYFLAPTRIDQEDSKIYCEDGFYDIANELAEFKVNAQYIQGDKIATGDLIYYNAIEKVVKLAGMAHYIELDKDARADTIIYYEETEETIMIGNASYRDDERSIAGPKIYYNAASESFKSSGRSTIIDSTTILTANSVEYVEESDLGVAYGNVELIDTSSGTTISSEAMFYRKSEQYSKAFNTDGTKPLLVTLMDDDSLFLKSDTLLSLEIKDSISYIQAYRGVRIFKSNLQAQCDSMSFNTLDSVLTMFHSPVIWSDSSQFSADTIEIFLKNKEIHKVNLRQKGFIINTADSIFFNQIKGKFIEVFFQDSKLDSMMVEGNAESIYFMMDDNDAYIGMNKSISSKMSFNFENEALKDIFFLVNVNSNLIPMRDVSPTDRLEGFRWMDKERPKNKEEL